MSGKIWIVGMIAGLILLILGLMKASKRDDKITDPKGEPFSLAKGSGTKKGWRR